MCECLRSYSSYSSPPGGWLVGRASGITYHDESNQIHNLNPRRRRKLFRWGLSWARTSYAPSSSSCSPPGEEILIYIPIFIALNDYSVGTHILGLLSKKKTEFRSGRQNKKLTRQTSPPRVVVRGPRARTRRWSLLEHKTDLNYYLFTKSFHFN